jgi:site-specific DNA-methyltransferase (adenine-specific)
MAVIVHHGDSRDVLKTIADASIDSCVCDPPYALVSIVKRFGKQGSAPAKGNAAYMRASAGFMGKTWDTGETEQPAQDAESALPLFASLAGAE